MSTHYRGKVTVELVDEYRMVNVPPVEVHVMFESDDDPREMLSHTALVQAAALTADAERFYFA